MQFLLTDGLEEIALVEPGETVGSFGARGLGRRGIRILAFDDEDSAMRLLRRCATDPAALAALRRLDEAAGRRYAPDRSGRSGADQVLRSLARSLAHGALVAVARNRVALANPAPTAQPPPPDEPKPAPPPPGRPTERPPPEETMVPAPVAQAAVLEAAAASGAPLCET